MKRNLPKNVIVILCAVALVCLLFTSKSPVIKITLSVFLILIGIIAYNWHHISPNNEQSHSHTRHDNPIIYATTSNQTAKPKNSVLTLSSVRRPGEQQEPAGTIIPTNEQILVPNQPKPIELSDLEKELNHVKTISDLINELTLQIKRTEKNKTDNITRLKQSEEGLKTELKSKESQLDELSEKLHSQPALRALINVKKTFGDMSRTKKVLTTAEAINFIVETIDQKLIDLDIQKIEFPEGTKLSDMPFDQIDTSEQAVATENESQNNTVARLISPCYFIISDSRKVIINKAIVSLYRFTPPSPQPQISKI